MSEKFIRAEELAEIMEISVPYAKEMNFWTKDEYMQFSEVMMDLTKYYEVPGWEKSYCALTG